MEWHPADCPGYGLLFKLTVSLRISTVPGVSLVSCWLAPVAASIRPAFAHGPCKPELPWCHVCSVSSFALELIVEAGGFEGALSVVVQKLWCPRAASAGLWLLRCDRCICGHVCVPLIPPTPLLLEGPHLCSPSMPTEPAQPPQWIPLPSGLRIESCMSCASHHGEF